MKSTTFSLAVLAACVVNSQIAFSLREITMDTYLTTITVDDPSSSYLSTGTLKSHGGMSYASNRNKTLILSAPKGYSILAAIRLLDLRPNNQDYLMLYTNDSVRPFKYSNVYSFQRRIYDTQEYLNTFYAPNGQLGVIFYTGPFATWGYDGFELTFTAQAEGIKCRYGNFRCANRRCISDMLTCDGHNHCGDRSDQRHCSHPIYHGGRIAGIVGGVIFLLIAVACAIFIMIRRTLRTKSETRTIIHNPPPTSIPVCPSYPDPRSYFPPPPPPYTPYNQGVTNPGYQ